jgi:uncharacterized protein
MIALLEQHRATIANLCEQYGVEQLEVFGSAARNNDFAVSSDVDLIVRFSPHTDLAPWLTHLQNFQVALEQLLGRPVDLLMDAPIRNPYVAQVINSERRPIYAAP